MKKYLVSAVLCAALIGTGLPARADTPASPGGPVLASPSAAPDMYSYLKLKNISPRIVAWWLDAEHQPEPYEFKSARQTVEANGLGVLMGQSGEGTARRGAIMALPEGIKSVVAVDAQSALLTMGTAEATAKLEKLVALLDRPLRQVEIEARTVLLTPKALQALGLDKPGAKDSGALRPVMAPLGQTGLAQAGMGEGPSVLLQAGGSLRFVRSDYTANVVKLEAEGEAKTISAPRVVSFSNLPAVICDQSVEPVTAHASADGVFPEAKLFVGARRGFGALPTVNNDESITLALTPFLGRGIMQGRLGKSDEPDPSSWVAIPGSTVKTLTITNVKDGETIALRGAMVSGTGKPLTGDGMKLKGAPAEIVLFVTTRIIRRVDGPTPGT